MAKQDHLGEFEQLALLAVLRLGDDAYGASIQEELDRTAGRDAALSSIYITLTRLEEKGLVASRMGGSSEGRGGRARRFFRLLPKGIEALQEARDRLLSMWDGFEGQLDGELGTARGG